jgi:NNP family nitrate/nitrite transporter-like MFS transporter
MLVLATIGFAVNFWAWALISPLGALYLKQGADSPLGQLSQSEVALMVAVPVLVGSLGRIIVGALTDRYGGRIMFPVISGITIVPVLFLAFFALDSYTLMLFGGFFLGIAGTSFAVGVPFVNAWFPPERRGFAVGVFGAGMGGTAISALTTVPLTQELGRTAPFLITAAVLAVYAVVAWLVLRDAPGRVVPTTSLGSRLAANSKLPITWQACILYAVAFGGYVAFSVFLPTYLKTAHGLEPADAANRMAGFVVVAVISRPVGGWLSDRIGSIPVLAGVFATVAVCAAIAAGNPPLDGIGTVAFLVMAAALGGGSGATFALIAHSTDPARVGGVTGLVGAAGGLGGFVPPLLMGWIYGQTDSYGIGLWLLAGTAALTLLLTLTVVRRTAAQHAHSQEATA